MQVHQIIQGFSYGDGTSNLSLKIQKLAGELGYSGSRIFSLGQNISPTEKDKCADFNEHRSLSGPDNVLIYHFGNASPLSEYYLNCPDKKILVYHNVTPGCFFRAVSPERADNMERSYAQLKTLRDKTDITCAISRYNMEILKEYDFKNIRHFSEWMDPTNLSIEPAADIMDKYRDGATNLMFVGRVAPNKKVEDVLKVFYYYQKCCAKKRTRLFIVGSYTGMELYYSYLLSICKDMGLSDVVFTGHVTQAMLNAYYRCSHAFLCASEHEGFCVPLLEASYFKMPVFAFAIPAIRETLAGAGIIWNERNYIAAAETINPVLENPKVLNAVVDRQQKRLEDFGEDIIKERLRAILNEAKTI